MLAGPGISISECSIMISVFMCDVQLYDEHYIDIIIFFQSGKGNRLFCIQIKTHSIWIMETISHDTTVAIAAIQSHSQDQIPLPFCATRVTVGRIAHVVSGA